jgi:hypothetical protein
MTPLPASRCATFSDRTSISVRVAHLPRQLFDSAVLSNAGRYVLLSLELRQS